MEASTRKATTSGARRWRRWLLPVQLGLLVTAVLGLAVPVAGSGAARGPLIAAAAVAAVVTVALLARAAAGLRPAGAGRS
jgi:hypothetical protein